jgi:hypothetical protein
MICEVLGAVQCLAICVINVAAAQLGPSELIVALWAAGIGGMAWSASSRDSQPLS